MKFPITRDELQAYTVESFLLEVEEEDAQKRIKISVETLCREFNRYFRSNIPKKQFAWIGLQMIPQDKSGKKKYMIQFFNEIKSLFVDCKINMDTSGIAIIIDWS